MSPSALTVLVAIAAGYLVGCIPVAWMIVRRRHGIDLRDHGLGGTGTIDALLVAGPAAAVNALVLEFLKGAFVGVGARLWSPTGWFTATAIAACVTGDAFPIGFRRGGRGLVPLISGLLFALPFAGAITALMAVPAAMLTRMRGHVYDTVVAIAVPAGLVAGTDDLVTLVPAAVIVVVLLARQRLRRAQRAALTPGWRRVTVIDRGRPGTPPPG